MFLTACPPIAVKRLSSVVAHGCQGKTKPPVVYVWDVETLEVLRTIDAANTAANIQRSISGLAFSLDSSKLFLVRAGKRQQGHRSALTSWDV